MKNIVLTAFFVLLVACGPKETLSENTLLWRVHGWKAVEGGARVSTATILTFRSSGEYVELHTRVIERPDATVYVASDSPRLTIVGTWTRDGDVVTATRQRIKRPTPFAGPRDPLCDETLQFRIEGRSVRGKVVEPEEGQFSPVTRLVAPEFESYATEARQTGAACVEPET